MKHINKSDFHLSDTAVALGKFEGIHRGHQLLIDRVVSLEREGLVSVVFTFDRPPRLMLYGDDRYQQIYTPQERMKILEKKGVDVMIEHPFTREFAALSPEDFIRHVLVEKAGAKVIVVGEDFRFGRKRSGSIDDLKRLEEECGYRLLIFEKLKIDGQDVSSTRIRDCLAAGDMEKAGELLGRPFSISGQVVHGKELGRRLNFPTINQQLPAGKLVPGNGVYITRVHTGDASYYGVTNIGVKPTVSDQPEKNAETYILDYEGDLYGQDVAVDLLHFCRKEMKFDSIEDLQAQLVVDVEKSRDYIRRQLEIH